MSRQLFPNFRGNIVVGFKKRKNIWDSLEIVLKKR